MITLVYNDFSSRICYGVPDVFFIADYENEISFSPAPPVFMIRWIYVFTYAYDTTYIIYE